MRPSDCHADGTRTARSVPADRMQFHFGRRDHELVPALRRRAACNSLTRQPWCCRVPWKGGAPVTLPVSRMADGSKPAGTSTVSPSFCGSTGSSVRCSLSTACALRWISRTPAPTWSSVALRDVFEQEIEQPALALEQRQQAQRLGGRLDRLGRLRGRRVQQRIQSGCESGVGQDAAEGGQAGPSRAKLPPPRTSRKRRARRTTPASVIRTTGHGLLKSMRTDAPRSRDSPPRASLRLF